MKSPMIVTGCGHSFEESAIRDWLNKHNKCPICNGPANVDTIVKNFTLADILNARK